MPTRPETPDDQLLRRRIVFLRDPIDDGVSNQTVARLLYLQTQDPERDILLCINSPGGSVTATLAIHDVVAALRCDVATHVMGQAAAGACLIAAAGAKGKRTATPNARLMVHQPWGYTDLGATPEERATFREEIGRMKKAVRDIFVRHTRQPEAVIQRELEEDRFVSAAEAEKLGIIDRLVPPRARAAAKGPRPAEKRVVRIEGDVDDACANEVVIKLLALEDSGPGEEVCLEIDSGGGSVTASLMLYDVLRQLACPVATLATGEAQGTACLLLAAGDRSRRFARAHARIGYAYVFGGTEADPDIEIQVEEIKRLRSTLWDAFATHTGRTGREIAAEFDTGKVLSPEQARAQGLIDAIIAEGDA